MDEIIQKDENTIKNKSLNNIENTTSVKIIKPKMPKHLLCANIIALFCQVLVTLLFIVGVSKCFRMNTSVLGILNLVLLISNFSFNTVLKVCLAVLYIILLILILKLFFTNINNLTLVNEYKNKNDTSKLNTLSKIICINATRSAIYTAIFSWACTLINDNNYYVHGIVCVVVVCIMSLISTCLLNFKLYIIKTDNKIIFKKSEFIFAGIRNLFLTITIIMFFAVINHISLSNIWFGIRALFMGALFVDNFIKSLCNVYNFIIRDILLLIIMIKVFLFYKDINQVIITSGNEKCTKEFKLQLMRLLIFLVVVVFIFGLSSVVLSGGSNSIVTVQSMLNQMFTMAGSYFAGVLILLSCYIINYIRIESLTNNKV